MKVSESQINEDLEKEFEQLLRELVEYNASVPKSEQLLVNLDDGTVRKRTIRKSSPSIGRNEPCPCGSGKKYKKCCMEK